MFCHFPNATKSTEANLIIKFIMLDEDWRLNEHMTVRQAALTGTVVTGDVDGVFGGITDKLS